MIAKQTFIVTTRELPVRLDKFLCIHFPRISRSLIIQSIESSNVLVNGVPSVKGRKLREHDAVAVNKLFEVSDRHVSPNKNIHLDIVFEDNDILVINKPAGIPVHPIRLEETETLTNGLVACYPELAQVGDDPFFPAFVHRIDTDTSGLIVAAKNNQAYKNLRKQFREKRIKKIYLAVVHGDVAKSGKIDSYLIHDPKDDRRMRVVDSCHCEAAGGGRSDLKVSRDRLLRAITQYKPLKHFGTHTFLEVEIKTGVMHQIRCQLANIGHPIVGDKIYRSKQRQAAGSSEKAGRHMLHAQKIGFTHPVTGENVQFEAKLPDDFKKLLTK